MFHKNEYKALLEMVEYITQSIFDPDEETQTAIFEDLYNCKPLADGYILGLSHIGKIYKLSEQMTKRLALFAYRWVMTHEI